MSLSASAVITKYYEVIHHEQQKSATLGARSLRSGVRTQVSKKVQGYPTRPGGIPKGPRVPHKCEYPTRSAFWLIDSERWMGYCISQRDAKPIPLCFATWSQSDEASWCCHTADQVSAWGLWSAVTLPQPSVTWAQFLPAPCPCVCTLLEVHNSWVM